MPAIYKQDPVTVLRPVIPGEPAFKEDDGEQLLIRTRSGLEQVVHKADVKEVAEPLQNFTAVPQPAAKEATVEKTPAPKAKAKKVDWAIIKKKRK